jgi:hypothetical protein
LHEICVAGNCTPLYPPTLTTEQPSFGSDRPGTIPSSNIGFKNTASEILFYINFVFLHFRPKNSKDDPNRNDLGIFDWLGKR